MLLLLPINKLAELTLFSTSGNPNHQIFLLQLCRILFDVLTLKTLERKLFSPWFFVCLGVFFCYTVSIYCNDNGAKVQVYQTRLINPMSIDEAHVLQKS